MALDARAPTEPCPDLEELAAFIDGRLPASRRGQMVEHLNRCEICQEVFADTVRFQEEDRPAGEVRPFWRSRQAVWRSRQAVWAAALVAAAVLLVAVVVPRWGVLGLPADLPVDALTRPLYRATNAATLVAAAYSGDGWSRTRGFHSFLNDRQRAFRLGVRVVDLDVALRAGDRQQALRLLPEIRDMSEDLPLPEPILYSYDDLLKRLEDGEDPAGLAEQSVAAERLLADAADPLIFPFGKWAEGGLLASAAGDRSYFRRRTVRAFPERLEGAGLPADVSEPLSTIHTQLAGGVGAMDFAVLKPAFTGVVERGGDL